MDLHVVPMLQHWGAGLSFQSTTASRRVGQRPAVAAASAQLAGWLPAPPARRAPQLGLAEPPNASGSAHALGSNRCLSSMSMLLMLLLQDPQLLLELYEAMGQQEAAAELHLQAALELAAGGARAGAVSRSVGWPGGHWIVVVVLLLAGRPVPTPAPVQTRLYVSPCGSVALCMPSTSFLRPLPPVASPTLQVASQVRRGCSGSWRAAGMPTPGPRMPPRCGRGRGRGRRRRTSRDRGALRSQPAGGAPLLTAGRGCMPRSKHRCCKCVLLDWATPPSSLPFCPALFLHHASAQGRDHRWEAAAVQGLARLREQQLELQSSSRRWVLPCLPAMSGRVCVCLCLPCLPRLVRSHRLAPQRVPTPPFCARLCREGFVGLSAADTIRQCLRLGLKDQAQKLAREFKVGCAWWCVPEGVRVPADTCCACMPAAALCSPRSRPPIAAASTAPPLPYLPAPSLSAPAGSRPSVPAAVSPGAGCGARLASPSAHGGAAGPQERAVHGPFHRCSQVGWAGCRAGQGWALRRAKQGEGRSGRN